MTGAMYAAIGGLKTHMTKLNVIGNNLANVNTYGYKAQRMTFRESIYATNKSGSNGTALMGGNNPSQIGYGCSVGSIDLNMSPSTYSPTGYGLDCMMTGEGFFLVGDKINYTIEDTVENGVLTKRDITGSGIRSATDLTIPSLTRVGDFWVDADGYICNRDNKVLYGFARVQNPYYVPNPSARQLEEAEKQGVDIVSQTIISTELVPLRVPLSAAAPTKDATVDVNGTSTTVKGNGGIITIKNEKGEDVDLNLWEEGDPVYPYLSGGEPQMNRYAYNDDMTNTFYADNYDDETGTTVTIPTGEGSRGKSQIPVAKNGGENSVSGELPVQMKNMQIGTDGAISGTVNGKTVVIGYIAIATADSPDGVTNTGGHYYKAMGGAGNLRVNSLVEFEHPYLGNQAVAANAADHIMVDSGNSIQNGGLEASSTDVATEFAEMITAQRGYQVNTRIISVTDQMLEELANMKR